jgi:hypothetical protein
MLSAAERIRSKTQQTQRREARDIRRGDLQSDTRYTLPARLMDLSLDLAYDRGHGFGGQEFVAERLGVLTPAGEADVKKIARAYKRLEGLGLISVASGDIYPLPRLDNGRTPTKQDFRAWLEHWLSRPGTDFNYRTVRYIRDRSFNGNPVALSYDAIAQALGTEHSQQAKRAVRIGEQRRWIRRLGRGPRGTNLYQPLPILPGDIKAAGMMTGINGGTMVPNIGRDDQRLMVLDALEKLDRSRR